MRMMRARARGRRRGRVKANRHRSTRDPVAYTIARVVRASERASRRMATRQTYAVVCDDAIRGGSASESLGLLHWHNRLVRGREGASPFIECRTARTRRRMRGTHSWLDAHRDAEWKLSSGVTVVFCTQAGGRDEGAKF